ncbi:MAG: hypothetical protein J6K42_02450 [Clostridia bacterium]|nr:hypothetical protein [Clostridia bacterium]
MIDIHSHILNNVDDGSKSLDNTIDNLKKAEQADFTDVILTPHYIEGYYENTKNKIKNKINELKKEIYKEDIIIQLHQGNEILLTENTPSLLAKSKISTLANSRYILFEIPFSNRMFNLGEIIYKIKADGHIPILAHPERYTYIQENPNNLIEIIKHGVLVQSNYGSFAGQYGKTVKQTAEILLQNNLIHFLGTDTHRQGYIYENIKAILKRLEEVSGDERYIYEITTTNPKKILDDLDIYIDCPEKIRDRKKVFFFF